MTRSQRRKQKSASRIKDQKAEAQYQKALKLPLRSRILHIRSNTYVVEFSRGYYVTKELGPFKSREEAVAAFEAHQDPYHRGKR